MAQPILIAIGGTGQNVLASYLRLAEMAGFEPAPSYVVDSDAKGPQFQTVSELRKRNTGRTNGIPERWLINPYPTSDLDRQTFGELFAQRKDVGQQLFESIFSLDAEKTAIRTGMYGRPAMGATCMRLKMLSQDDDLQELKRRLQGDEKHVILVGSCFGGTGSGGVPILAQKLDELNREAGYSLRIEALVFLPWFRLVLPEGGASSDDRQLHEHLNQNFEPNAAASINFFRAVLRDRVESMIFIGVRDPGSITRTSRESEQEETVHALNLLAGVLVHNLFTELRPPHGVSAFWYDEDKGLDPEGLTLKRKDGDHIPLSAAVKRTTLTEQWTGILATLFDHFPELPLTEQPTFLAASLKRLRSRGAREKDVLNDISRHLRERRSRSRDDLKWVDELGDDEFLRFEPRHKRIQSEEYSRKAEDPLTTVGNFCEEADLPAKFDKQDFRSPQAFADKFTRLFLGHLTRQFEL